MQENIEYDVQKYKRRHQKRKVWRNFVRIMACVVVFCTTYALILPAITMEKEAFCGIEAHVHEDDCYGNQASLICDPGEGTVIHSHDELCYSGDTLICPMSQVVSHLHGDTCYETVTLEAHAHGEDCYSTQRGNLLCALSEEEGHAHGTGCYGAGTELLCTEAERAGHSHGESCYSASSDLTCTEAEDSGHSHNNGCYEQVLLCELEEKTGHSHSDACYEMVTAMSCTQEAREESITETRLVCTLPQVAVHTHSDSCAADCQIQQATEHQHTQDCIQTNAQVEENLICTLEVHAHTLTCFSNPEADVETKVHWDASVSGVTRTGDYRTDLVAIAKTQLGYNESTKNYIVEANGETIKGYSRYGAWYGVPYGDWCAMFASFCIRYAGIEGIPIDANCPNWIRQLQSVGLYHDEDDYIPQSGDLIFFDWNGDGSSDHVGIVVEVDGNKVKTIEGNSGDTVGYHTYNLSNVTIQGYCNLPRQLTADEQAAVDNVIALIEAMPSADEIDAKIEAFEEIEDYEGEETWLTEIYQQIGETYVAYRDLGEELQTFVTNRDKLLELEYIWSVMPLARIYVWFDGTCGGIESLLGSGDLNRRVEADSVRYTLPSTWPSPSQYQYVLRGWYDVTHGVYYPAGATVEGLENNTVFYADWRPATYDIGKNNEYVSNTVSTDHFITTRLYDYNSLFNVYSQNITSRSTSNSSHSETWTIVEKGKDALHKVATTNANGQTQLTAEKSMGFIFRDWDSEGQISMPSNWDQSPVAHYNNYHPTDEKKLYDDRSTSANEKVTLDGTTRGITESDNRILQRLFTTTGGVIGQEYLGTADHLFHYGTDPNNTETYGYYYYDSEYNAASYNQSDKRFYVYNYLEQTTDAVSDSQNSGKYADFLPFNSPYANTNGKQTNPNTTFKTSTMGYHYDSLTENTNTDTSYVGTNMWFGMKTDIKFFLPNNPGQTFQEDGQTVYGNKDMNGNDMIFEFTGDDDVWIFVDDVLVLDIGGVHGVMEGSINFSTGEIVISREYTDQTLYNGSTNESAASKEERKIQRYISSYLIDETQFPGGEQHILTMYYMERGDSLSNCRIRFNISPRYQMNIQKEDAVNRNKLDGAVFGVYTDIDCTQEAKLWPTRAAYDRGDPATHIFTVDNGQGTIWGMVAGSVYYIKELEAPVLDADGDGRNDYQIPKGLIKLTLKTDGETDYDVLEMVNDGHGDAPSNGFSAYGFKINPVTEQAYMVITNGKNVEETTDVTVEKVWNGGTERPNVKVYLKVGNERIRETTLSSKNNWQYTWMDLPKYSDDYNENGRIPLQYTVEEGLVPGYTGVVTQVGSYDQPSKVWVDVPDFESGGTYLLRNSSGQYLAVRSTTSTDTGYRWLSASAAQTEPLARWKATKNGDQVKLTNESGYTITYWTHTDFFAMSSAVSDSEHQKQYFNYQKTGDGGVRLYYDDATDRFMNNALNNNNSGKIDYVTSASSAMTLYPVTETTLAGQMFRITNTPTDQTTSVTVKKNWTMGDGVTAADPALYQDLHVTIRLKADGKDAGLPTRTLELVDGWSYTFHNLPVTNSAGAPIVYTVEEVWSNENWTPNYSAISGNAADGYQLNITNRYTPKIEIPVQKQWSGISADQRPGSLNVYLYKTIGNGQPPTAVGSVALTAANNWTGVFRTIAPEPGETYYIYESTDSYYATYANPAKVILDGKAVTMGQVSFDLDTGQPNAVIVTNQPRVDLPKTGGPGTILYTAGGLLLMLVAVILLHNQKKYRKEDRSFL